MSIKQHINPKMVNHPTHYNLPGRKECIVEIEELYGETVAKIFCLTSAYKYLYRTGHKYEDEKLQDIEKAKWYYNKAETYAGHVCFLEMLSLQDDIEKMLKDLGVLECD